MSSTPLRERVSPSRVGALLVVTALLVVLVLALDQPLTAEFVALSVVVLGFMTASVFDAVRSHPLYTLASVVELSVVFWVLYLGGAGGLFFLALACLALVGVAVELYNYRNGTSYLRFEA
ncbi:hypothetical protein [Halogeometricum luteum]|uniref:Phosphatidate cytidylyltransferase n=1 Tax=Halogeometricum luteum TaxID=2950537 RepID=A0ABU2G4V2_9EURY|nr:hypothetical protein [Halogeometricum sp. S3BR5-2]MDS0295822.1 hypothetical protein [Halogeometricum sp. S3BR5-2]